ncbi:hypothetical protein GCM10007036_30650 [Alsobacter metallidurans]|uniref:Uncharacterized protein n=1 Tax=Alsobacter metallidurans TaxID=340221 RepID=A0A917MIH0_9HYPH|nr:hypothetical protein GCM10007036_30650 [Alsobacter metallidurans]
MNLRPCEWRHAKLEVRKWTVRCAKSTNGRGLGEEKWADLEGFSDAECRKLSDFIEQLEESARERSWETLYRAMAKLVRRPRRHRERSLDGPNLGLKPSVSCEPTPLEL